MSEPRRPVRWLSVVGWTTGTTFVLAVFLWGLLSTHDAATGVGVNVGYFGAFVIGFGAQRKATLTERLLPMALSCLLVGAWPVEHWIATADAEPASAYALILSLTGVIIVGLTGFVSAARRQWIVDSPMRRAILMGALLVSGVIRLVGYPAGAWPHFVLLVVLMLNLFWPA